MEEDEDWYFRNAFEPSSPSALSSTIYGYPIQHNQQFDVPDISHGPNFESPTRNLDRAIDAYLPSSAQEPPPVDRPKCSQPTTKEPDSQSLAQQAAKPRAKEPRIPGGYHCPDCTRRPFDTACEMQKHQYQVHTSKSDRPHGCETCDERFLYQKDLNRHMRTHDRRSSSRRRAQVHHRLLQNLPTISERSQDPESTQTSGTSFEADDRALSSVKRRRCSVSAGERDHEEMNKRRTIHANSPPFQSDHYHDTADEFLVAGYRDLRRFSHRATHVAIIATIQDHEETMTCIAHHNLPASLSLEPEPDPQTEARDPGDDPGTKEASCVPD